MPLGPHDMLVKSRELRKTMTREQKHLYYDGLKNTPWKFRRQVVIGEYIVDFYCPALKLVIVVDPSQHFFETGEPADERMDEALRERGLRVLRYSHADINRRFDSVMSNIINSALYLNE